MKNAIEDLKNGKFSNRDEVADLQLYQLEGITYCLPINSSPELRQYLASVILAYKHNADFEDVGLFQDIKLYVEIDDRISYNSIMV